MRRGPLFLLTLRLLHARSRGPDHSHHPSWPPLPSLCARCVRARAHRVVNSLERRPLQPAVTRDRRPSRLPASAGDLHRARRRRLAAARPATRPAAPCRPSRGSSRKARAARWTRSTRRSHRSIWTTMMTGVEPARASHPGLPALQSRQPTSRSRSRATSGKRPRSGTWRPPAGKKVGAFGLWATYPAEPVNGLMVSDRLFTFLFSEVDAAAGVVFPARARGVGARRRSARAECSRTTPRSRPCCRGSTKPSITQRGRGHGPVRASRSARCAGSYRNARLRRRSGATGSRASGRTCDRLLSGDRQHRPRVRAVRAAAAAAVSRSRLRALQRRAGTYFAAIDELLGEYVAARRAAGGVADARLRPRLPVGGRPADDAVERRQCDGGEVALARTASTCCGDRASRPRTATRRPAAAWTRFARRCSRWPACRPSRDIAGPPLPGAPALAVDARRLSRRLHTGGAARWRRRRSTRAVDEDTLAKLRALGYIGAAGGQRPRARHADRRARTTTRGCC